ncbi:MAG: L,D-transpeptidase [Pseudomonadota bacterium]
MLRIWSTAIAALASLTMMGVTAAQATVRVKVDISSQRMHVYVNGGLRHVWKVSTGKRGYRTPTGSFRPTRLERSWHSRKYNWSPMPHSIFFIGGVAIHGSNYVRQLGRPASHGCVRLTRRNAARLFSLVRRHGPRRTRIVVTY